MKETLNAKYITPSDDEAVVADVLLADGALTLVSTTLDHARNLIVTVTDADSSLSAGAVTVVGKDDRGDAITETFTLPTSGTAVVTGTKMFKQITSATVASLAGEGAGDKVKIGTGATVQVFENVGTFGGITVGETAAGTVTVTDQDSKTNLKTIGILKASIAEGDYLMNKVGISKGLRIVLGAASKITVFYNRSTSN